MSLPPSVEFVLDVMRRYQVQALLMGGQACIVYGASEFSRDIDLAILADDRNLAALGMALKELRAAVIAIPQFEAAMLEAGHAVHFRCDIPAASGLRIDIMSRMRRVDPFSKLWERRLTLASGVSVLALPDLVAAKKTQRDKDWPMIRRLIEADYFARRGRDTADDVAFWLRECRTPVLLKEIVARYPHEAAVVDRTAVRLTRAGAAESDISQAIQAEESAERSADAAYWEPLRRQLEALRQTRRER
jgi:hypothetical protein